MFDALMKCLDDCFGALVEIPVNSCCQHRSSDRCGEEESVAGPTMMHQVRKGSNLCNQNAKCKMQADGGFVNRG